MRVGRTGDKAVEAVLADWKTAPISGRLRAALAFLEKLTLTPGAVGAEDVIAVRGAGVSGSALREVIYVCFLFSTMDRLADAFGFEVASEKELIRGEWFLRHFGYARMSVPG